MKIEWLISGAEPEWIEENYRFGGRIYETYARKILKSIHELNVTYLCRGNHRSKIIRALEFGRYILKNKRIKLKGEIVIRDPYSTVFAPFDKQRKNVVMLHHLDLPLEKRKRFFQIFKNRFYYRVRFADKIIVVSEYWKEILEKAGCSNVEVIYNSFDLSIFKFADQELSEFKKRLEFLEGKPIIYLGISEPEKGYLESYEALKDIDATFVTTGRNRTNLPIINRYLSYRDYLKLLKISTLAIMMSKFEEGWCRNAHEAMLCGTPVIGSGRGGMGELLTRGGQLICDEFSKIRSAVIELLDNKQTLYDMSLKGKKYAGQFSLDYFKERWLNLIAELGQ